MLRLAIGLIFIVVPMIELMLLIKIGQSIGALATVAFVVATALTGAFIISRQSLAVVSRTLEALSEGRTPVEPVADGLFLLVAGALLLTPGLITDAVALALLVPPIRRVIARAGMQWLRRRALLNVESFTQEGAPQSRAGRPRQSRRDDHGPIIEGEFERLDEGPSEPRRNRGRGSGA
jgi:UPF0716 protein FxsA